MKLFVVVFDSFELSGLVSECFTRFSSCLPSFIGLIYNVEVVFLWFK